MLAVSPKATTRVIRTPATFIVAAANSPNKNRADYICDGVADEVQINAAIVATAAAGGRTNGAVGEGGEVHLLAGSYSVAAPIVMLTRVSLIGHGNLQSVRISSAANSGHGIYFKAWDAANSPISVDERGQFKIANVNMIMSLTQSAASWGIYIDNDDTEWLYNCIFDNVYVSAAKSGGMYVKKEEESCYNQCIFTGITAGSGFYSDGTSKTTFNQCRFSDSLGHCCRMEGAGSFVHFSNCSFNESGFLSGLCISNDALTDVTVSNCTAQDNYDSGFFVEAGLRILFVNCIAYRNVWAEHSGVGGFRIGGGIVTDSHCSLVNCISSYNDGENAATEDHGGAGYYIKDNNVSLIGCKSDYNNYGVLLKDCSNLKCDVDFIGNDTYEFSQGNGTQNSIGRTCQDTFTDVVALSTNGIKAAIVNTTPVTVMDGQMAVPRNVTVTGDGTATGNVYIQGVSADGKVFDGTACDESIVVSAGATVQGNIAWAKITKITRTTAVGSIDVGWGDKLGLTNLIRATSDVYKITINRADDALTDYTINATYGTVLPDVAINANDDFVIYYKGF